MSPLKGKGIKEYQRVREASKVEPGILGNRCSLYRVCTSEKSCKENPAYEN